MTKEGFTLIEIIVAIAIVGMLLAGAFGAFRYVQNAKKSTTRSKLITLGGAIEMYKSTTNQLPSRLEDLIEKPANVKHWTGDYVTDEEALKDAWGNEFVYRPNPKNPKNPYELYSYGPEGEMGAEKDQIHLKDI
jgi:general secretion pathway protein G